MTIETIKELRALTNVSMAVCKKALAASGDDVAKAVDWLRIAGELKAADLSTRSTDNGAVISYIHPGNRVGVLLKVACETDFVAIGEDFLAFCKDVAMHIAASNPRYVSIQDARMDAVFIGHTTHLIAQAMLQDPKLANKPEQMLSKIADGKLEKGLKEVCLLDQDFVKDPTKTIATLLAELVLKTGENIQVLSFVRFVV